MLVALLPVLVLAAREVAAQPGSQPFTVRDTIEHDRFDPVTRSTRSKIAMSPDGKRFFVIVASADVAANVNRSQLRVYSTASVAHFVRGDSSSNPPAPQHVFDFASSSPRRAIDDARWESDSRHIALLAERPGGKPQLHRLDGESGGIVQLTQEPHGVWSYGANGGAFVYASLLDRRTAPHSETSAPFMVGEGDGLRELLQLGPVSESDLGRARLAVITVDGGRLALDWPDRLMLRDFQMMWVSPDGRWAVATRPVTSIPPSWGAHAGAHLEHVVKPTGVGEEVSYHAVEYVIVDLRTGQVRTFVDAPAGYVAGSFQFPSVVWGVDNRRFFVNNALLPADPASNDPDRSRRPVVLEVDAESGRWSLVGHAPPSDESVKSYSLYDMQWDHAAQSLTVRRYDRLERIDDFVFTRIGKGWRSSRRPGSTFVSLANTKVAGDIELAVFESVSQPEVLRARDIATGRQRDVLMPLSALIATRKMAQVREYIWRSSDGGVWKGALYTPADRDPNERLPLVLQTHGYYPESYRVDGPHLTAFAAQALASHGMFVLQIQDKNEVQISSKEIPTYLAGYEGAIEALVADGLVDPKRVGAIGFSRTCFHVRSALAFTDRLAAAVLSDGVDYGYLSYLLAYNIVPGRRRASMERGILPAFDGKSPFGEGLATWSEKSPTFNLHRVRAPVRLEGIGRVSVLFNWEWYAGLAYLGKPVELHVIPDDEHQLRRPRNRYASLQGSVDWFDFWLNGREDDDAAKKEQYARWRELHEMQEKATTRAPD